MNFLHGNDKKRIKSALNDKKRNGVKLTIQEVIYGGKNSSSKMVQQMIKSVLKSVYMIRNDKSYCHLLSFSLFWAVNFCRFLSFFRPYSVPRRKICPSKLNSKYFIINVLQNPLVTFCVGKWFFAKKSILYANMACKSHDFKHLKFRLFLQIFDF